MKKTIAVIAGDGIGPEIVGEAVKVRTGEKGYAALLDEAR